MKGILLDIEGTTTPIAFVYDVLFPFARAHAAEYLAQDDVRALHTAHDLDVRNNLTPPQWIEPPIAYIHWLMDQDRKSTALKEIQGKIWLAGYQRGELHGEVFADVPAALARWQRAGIDVRIYSSGSKLAQRLLFSTTKPRDLTPLLNGYFDTTTGAKTERQSYASIAVEFHCDPHDILFISDVVRELDAAQQAGMQTALCVRPGNPPQIAGMHHSIRNFDEVEI